MVDILSLVLSHGLLALAAWRLLMRNELDVDPGDGDDRRRAVRKDALPDTPVA